jgi:hypothetical protein
VRRLDESTAKIASPDFVSMETAASCLFILMIICVNNLKARTGVYGLTAFDNLSLGKMSDPMNEGFVRKEKDK